MPDTRRALSALQTLLADNTSGAITAQNVRDFLVSVDGENSVQTGTFAAIPGSGQKAGDLYVPSDGFCVYRWSGSAWVPWGPVFPFVDPSLQSWSWVNQGSSVASATKGGILLDAASGGLAIRGRVKSQPAKPYKVDACFLICPEYGQWLGGLMWRDSASGKCVTFGWDNAVDFQPRADKWSDPSTLAASYANGSQYPPSPRPIWLRIEDDNTNRKCWLSADGQNWGGAAFHSVGNTDYLTADQVGFFATSRPAVNTRTTLLSWKES